MKLISAFVFAIRIVQSLYYLNPKFQASSYLLWLYSPVCVVPGQKPPKTGFLRTKLECKTLKFTYHFQCVPHSTCRTQLLTCCFHYRSNKSGIYEPRSEKTGLRGFRPGPTQSRLYSYRRWLEGLYYPFSENKGADQLRICKNLVFSR